MKIADLRASVQQHTSHVYDTYFTRKVSVFVTKALAATPLRANHVSAAGLFVGLGSCLLIALTHGGNLVVGVCLVHAYAILDSVDGELARLRRDFTLRGLFLEDLSAYYIIAGFPLAVGMAISRSGLSDLPLVLAAVYAAFGRNGIAVARRAVLKSIQTRRPAEATVAGRSGPASGVRELVDGHLLNHTNIRLVLSTVLLVESLAGRPLLLTAWLLTAVVVGLLLREAATVVYFLRGGSLEGMLSQVHNDATTPLATNVSAVDVFRLAKY